MKVSRRELLKLGFAGGVALAFGEFACSGSGEGSTGTLLSSKAKLPEPFKVPLPVPPGSAKDAVRFIDLSEYPEFFDDLDLAFPQSIPDGTVLHQTMSGSLGAPLVVQEGGLLRGFVRAAT